VSNETAAGNDNARELGTITAIETQQRRQDRVNVFIDGEFSFAVRSELAATSGLRAGARLTIADRDRILSEDERAKAYEAALGLLARRPRSEREVRDRLRTKQYPPDIIDAVIERLLDRGYLNDADFARFWVENRTAYRPRGSRGLAQELASRGVDRALVDRAIEDVCVDEPALAIEAARKKIGSMSGLEPDVRRRRLIGFLQRRGFSWDAIKRALAEVDDRHLEGPE
jgi:regulatory protein